MEEEIIKRKKENKVLSQEVRKLRKRELEIIKRWDMDDIDLVTERMKLIKSSTSSNMSKSIIPLAKIIESLKIKKKAKNPKKVPMLDFTRVYEIQQEQNMEYEEEEEEDEEEQEYGMTTPNSLIVNNFIDHSHLSESAKRQIELQSRKDKIIAILNNQYEDKNQESQNESDQDSEESPRTILRNKLGGDKKVITL